MNNFEFRNPTKIIFGKDSLKKLDRNVPKDAKVLITYGGESAKKYGTLDKVSENLQGREIFYFGGIEANPQFNTLVKAKEYAKENNIDFLLAVGGGSVMDGTKFINLLLNYDGEERDLLTPGFAIKNVKTYTKMGTVVTLPATGSEMNNGAVISHDDTKTPIFGKDNFPIFSVLDPELTMTLPKKQVANGIIDTFVHVCEQYLTYPVNALFQDRTSEGILLNMIEIGIKTIEDPTDYDARANLVWNATMALNGLIAAGVPEDWATHMIGHEMTAVTGLDHGVTLAIVLPNLLTIRKDKKREKLIQYGKRVWNLEGTDDEIIDGAIKSTREFFESLGVSTKLSTYGVTEKNIEQIIENLSKKGLTRLSETGDLGLDEVLKILNLAM